jgi:DNA ligase-1
MFIFDLLHLDGRDLLDHPLADRRAALAQLQFGERVQLAYATEGREPEVLAARFREARDRGNEGLVIKRPESRYQPGRRGSQWVKLKEELATLDVVVVAAEHGHGKRAGVLSDVTFAVRDGDRLAVIGKAYSGLTDHEIRQLTDWFLAHTQRDLGRVKVVEPTVVLEVAFDAVTRSDRHDSGYALRFPRIKRIRDDKTPDDVNTLEDVARIFEAQGTSRGGGTMRPGQGTPRRRRR